MVVAAGPDSAVVSPGHTILPLSQPNVLVLLVHVSPSGARTPAGRSYDGFDWEAGAALSTSVMLHFNCVSDGCLVTLPDLGGGDYYEIKEVEGPEAATDSESAACVHIRPFVQLTTTT